MLFVSSSCVRAEFIKDSIEKLARAGFRNIELSGGTKRYSDLEKDLLRLQDRYSLNYRVHNYFPPPQRGFVVNLASLDDKISGLSIRHCEEAIRLSKVLGSREYGVHAGFRIDVDPKEIGKPVKYKSAAPKEKVIARFSETWQRIKEVASGSVSLYLENNVFSSSNAVTFSGQNPFLLTDYEGYRELKQRIEFELLLDIAHLKVSARSLGLDFSNELSRMLPESDYIHLSENDGLHDQNKEIVPRSRLLAKLKKFNFFGKTMTLETYCSVPLIQVSYQTVVKELKGFEEHRG